MTDVNEDDEFANLQLDDLFVLGASTKELSAEDRLRHVARLQRMDRERLERIEQLRQARRPRRRIKRAFRLSRKPFALLATIVLAGTAMSWWWEHAPSTGGMSWASAPGIAAPASPDAGPTPNRSYDMTPLGTPNTSTIRPGGTYQFSELQPGRSQPVAYDPCRKISLVINNRTAPPNAQQMLNETIAAVTALTGLQFEIEGTTDEVPVERRDAYLPERYGNRWAPVLVAWSDPDELAALEGDVAGIGGSNYVELAREKSRVYVSGLVALDGPQLERVLEYGSWEDARSVVMHEFAHLVGLGHVDDTGELMNPMGTRGIEDFQDGDKAGLAQLGQGACFRDL